MVNKQDKRTKQQLLAELEKLQAAQVLKETEDWFSRVFYRGPVAITISDWAEGRVVDVNDSFLRLFGYTRQEIIGRTSAEFDMYASPKAREDMGRIFMESGRVSNYETAVRTKTGKPLTVLISAEKIVFKGQDHVVAMIVDITERKLAEEEAKLDRERAEEAEYAAKLGSWQFDVASQSRWWSPQMIVMMGFDPAKGTPAFEDFLKVIHSDDRAAIQKAFVRISLGEEPPFQDFRIISRDGELRYIYVSYYSKKDEHGRPVRYIGTVQDVTERKQAEQQLRRGEEILKIFVEHSPAAIAMFDREMRYLAYSRRFLTDYGLGERNLIGRSHYEVFPEIDEPSKEVHRRCLAGVVAKGENDLFRRLDGKEDRVNWEIHPWREADGTIGGIVLFSEVTTEKWQAEAALRQSEERFKALIESLPVGIAVTSVSGKLMMVNEALQRMRGYDSREEMMRATIAERYYDPADRERWLQIILGTGKSEGFEILLKRKDNSLFWASFDSIITVSLTGEKQIINVVQDITTRKRAEEALRESEEGFRNLVENVPVGIVVSSVSGRVITINKALLGMHGYSSREEFDKKAIADRYYDQADRERWLRDVREQGRVDGMELRLKRKDGSAFWASFHSLPQISKAGEQQFITIVQDITERKRVEEALRQSEQSLRQLSEASFEGVVIHDQGKIVMANEAYARLNGCELSEIIGKDVSDFTAPESRDSVQERIRGRSKEPYEAIGMRCDGSRFISEIHGTDIEYQGRRLRAAAVRDITGRKKIEDALRASEEKYRELVNRINDGIFSTDIHGVLTFANQALARIHGFNLPDEIIGKSFLQFVTPEMRDEIAIHFRASVISSSQQKVDVSIIRNDGSIAYVQVNAVPIIENGKVIGMTGVLRDVTEQKAIQSQLIAAGRLASIGQLAAGIAHELNNPLTSVIGFSDLIIRKPNIPPDIKEDLEMVNREAKRTSGIIRGLLTFARERKSEREPADVNGIIQAVLQLRAYEHKANNIEVEARLDSELPKIIGNVGELQQVMLNLVVNAEQAVLEAHGRGKLVVASERVVNMVRVSVKDDGPGISPENLEKLFTPFFTTKDPNKGTGLGLSICHGIIIGHGGRIYAESEPGKGATFIVELPIPSPKTPAP